MFKNKYKHLHVAAPVSIGLVIWYCSHSAAIWKASRGTMRHAILTTSPCCARKAVRYEHALWKTLKAELKSIDFVVSGSVILTIKERIEVFVAVEVHAGVLATRVVVSGWKSNLERKGRKKSYPCLTSVYLGNGSVVVLRLTFTRLVIHALRYLMAISTTTGSFDRVSCLNKAPQVAWVDDFKNCRTKGGQIPMRTDPTQLKDPYSTNMNAVKMIVFSPDWNVLWKLKTLLCICWDWQVLRPPHLTPVARTGHFTQRRLNV